MPFPLRFIGRFPSNGTIPPPTKKIKSKHIKPIIYNNIIITTLLLPNTKFIKNIKQKLCILLHGTYYYGTILCTCLLFRAHSKLKMPIKLYLSAHACENYVMSLYFTIAFINLVTVYFNFFISTLKITNFMK